ncbi:MAG: hypothetical protein PHD82_10635, partial [Candidatus Riflebacteria bacterium]|nr:hypothetical protein [Candidatus Riflebacteria bacterium]
MQQKNSKPVLFYKFRATSFILLLAAVVALLVWRSFASYSASSNEYHEAEVRRKLLTDLKYIQRSNSKSLHIGNFLAGQALSNGSTDLVAGIYSSDRFPVNDNEKVREGVGIFKDAFSWAFFPANLPANSREVLIRHEILGPPGVMVPDQQKWEAVRLLATRGLATLFDLKFSEESRHEGDQFLRRMLDDKTQNEQNNFICSAVRNFQPCFINGIHYRLMWFPVFKDRARETPGWLKSSVEVPGENSLEDLSAFRGIVAVLYDEDNFRLAAGRRFEHALVKNIAQTGCSLEIAKSSASTGESGDFSKSENEIYRVGGWLKVRIALAEFGYRQVVLARKIPAETRPVRLMRNLVFVALLAWLSAIVYFAGNHLVMGRMVRAGLRTQLAAIVAIFLLPAFLQAMISMERYLDSSRNSALQRIRYEGEEALDALDKSVRLFRARLCSFVDDEIYQAGQSENSILINGSTEEQKLWLVKFLKTFREVGIIMKNAI